MARAIIMPRFGMTQEDATIVRWLKQEGERVESGDPICEVTTDKVNMEVEAPTDGILAGLRYPEGETVPVTEVIAYVLAEGETLPDGTQAVPAADVSVGQAPGAMIQAAATGIRATPVARRMAELAAVDLSKVSPSGADGKINRLDVERFLSEQAAQPIAPAGKLRATPAARRLAEEHHIDLAQISGSGLGGRVQGWDVQAALARQAEPAEVTPPAEAGQAPAQVLLSEGVSEIKLEGMRRTIAQRMQASWQQIPHITFTIDIEMTQAEAMRQHFSARFGGGISMTAVLVKACAAALRQHILLNSYFREDHLLVMPEINIGVAVALEQGLIVPVVRHADNKGLLQIGQEVSDLSRRARDGALRPEDVVDGTFTITNLGMLSVDAFTAIINPPQVAILAVGRIAPRFVPDEAGRPVLRAMMTVTLSVDHRAVDGAAAARFLATLKGILETAGAQWG
jgi:pyruvate dehydrogenase E2 component (dihydrolipoamide acetyltransferase)